jgi:hypothetical protein
VTGTEEERLLESITQAARRERAPQHLGARVLEHVAYRRRLEAAPAPRRHVALWAAAAAAVAVLSASAWQALRGRAAPSAPISAETPSTPGRAAATGASASPSSSTGPRPDPCSARSSGSGSLPLIDDFEDGDDAVSERDGRAGFWRWARDTDKPGTAPALLPIPRLDAHANNRLALHAKGGALYDWGATLEADFTPPCYDASAYLGVAFEARGPGRVYLAVRQVDVIPVTEGGTCEHDCHNPHVAKVELSSEFHTYTLAWSELRQRGSVRPALDVTRLHSIALLIRPEDTPYDVWLDDVRFALRR